MVAATAWLALSLPLQLAAADPALLGASGLPLPRFVSLRSDEANLRSGPGRNYPIDWIYRRSGLPLQVIDEFDTWRRVRDHDGTAGWMHRSVLSGRRSVIVTGTRSLLRRDPNPTAPGRAYLETGVIGDLTDCDGAWCRIEVEGFEGWLARDEIWGADPLE
jgi:SH3-like domain-containing protein